MPCSDGGPSSADMNYELKNKLDALTDMMCSLMGALKDDGSDTYERLPENLRAWHKVHIQQDITRIKRELKDVQNRIRALEEAEDRLKVELEKLL